jgi:hypothetical protein
MTRYGSGDPTMDVAALELGTAAGDEHADETRQRAVESVVGHLQRREGEVMSVPIGVLKQEAWDVDAGATADSAREAWESYVRPALTELSTVENSRPGRWRYCGLPDRAETVRQAGDAETADHDPNPDNENQDATGVLSDEARAGIEVIKRVKSGDGNAALLDQHVSGTDTDSDAVLAPDETGTRTPDRVSSSDDGREQMDPETVAARVERGDAGSQARTERRAHRRAQSNEEANATLAADTDVGMCAQCGDAPAEVDAPLLDARFSSSDELCQSCFQTVALGAGRVDGLDGGE